MRLENNAVYLGLRSHIGERVGYRLRGDARENLFRDLFIHSKYTAYLGGYNDESRRTSVGNLNHNLTLPRMPSEFERPMGVGESGIHGLELVKTYKICRFKSHSKIS